MLAVSPSLPRQGRCRGQLHHHLRCSVQERQGRQHARVSRRYAQGGEAQENHFVPVGTPAPGNVRQRGHHAEEAGVSSDVFVIDSVRQHSYTMSIYSGQSLPFPRPMEAHAASAFASTAPAAKPPGESAHLHRRKSFRYRCCLHKRSPGLKLLHKCMRDREEVLSMATERRGAWRGRASARARGFIRPAPSSWMLQTARRKMLE